MHEYLSVFSLSNLISLNGDMEEKYHNPNFQNSKPVNSERQATEKVSWDNK